MLKPGLRRVWRDRSTLQFGLDPERAMVLTGVDRSVTAVLESLDGTRDRDAVLDSALEAGLDGQTTQRLLDVLAESGLLDDAARDTTAIRDLPADERERLAPDLLALSLLAHSGDGGLALLERRRQLTVEVRGGGRVGAALACMLGAAGVGHVLVEDATITTHADRAPAGPGRHDVGASRAEAVCRTLRRVSTTVRSSPGPVGVPPDLVVLAPDAPDLAPDDALVRAGQPHLVARVRETTGVVGPLVVPGSTACLRCLDLVRADRDPAWPVVAAQLATPRGPYACDGVLATVVAGLAAMQALAFLDGGRPVLALDGTLELGLFDGCLRRRSWLPHPSCGCGWPDAVLRQVPRARGGDGRRSTGSRATGAQASTSSAPDTPDDPPHVTMGA
ncbi:MAG: ThiF family adenylyltransferase [Actinomycetes bacterium]